MRNLVIRAGLGLCLLASAAALSACGDDEADASGTGGSSATGGANASGGSSSTGGDGSGTGGEGLGGAGTGGVTATGGASGACESSVQSPNDIPETQGTGTYPAPAGGTIADGTYYLTSFEVYAPGTADSHVRARAIVIEGSQLTTINVDDNAPAVISQGVVNTAGTNLDVTFSCPNAGANVQIGYTATATELWIHDTDEPNVQKYTKQ